MIDSQAITTLIFDFDGTIAATLELHRQIYNQLARKYQRDEIQSSDIPLLRNLGMRDFLQKMKIPLRQLPALILEAQRLAHNYPLSEPIPGLPAVIQTLSRSHTLGIVTSNTAEHCQAFLRYHQLAEFFAFVQAERDLFGKDHKLKKLLKTRKLRAAETVYIGDEVRDIEAAKKVPLKSVGVGWGFNSTTVLQKAQPDVLVTSPQELLSFFTKRQ